MRTYHEEEERLVDDDQRFESVIQTRLVQRGRAQSPDEGSRQGVVRRACLVERPVAKREDGSVTDEASVESEQLRE